MRFSIDFLRAVLVMLRHFFPIWCGIAILISLMGLIIAKLEDEISAGTDLYFAWVTGTTVSYGDLVPTVGIIRVLVIVVALMGIVLTGTVVTTAIETAKIAIENDTSIQKFMQAVRESAVQRVARDRKRRPKRRDKEG